MPVGPDLSIEGHPEVFVVGDIAWITDTKTNQILAQFGSVALQSGELAGENIAHPSAGRKILIAAKAAHYRRPQSLGDNGLK